MEEAEDYCLTFEVTGEKILQGIKRKLKNLDEELKRIYTKARQTINHPKVEQILAHADEIYLLYPTEVPGGEEEWQRDPEREEEYRQRLNAVQIAELYHELQNERRILEAIQRNLDPEEEHELTTTQLLLLGL